MKSCLLLLIANIAWFILWGSCLYFGESLKMSPFTFLFICIVAIILIAIIGLAICGFIDNKRNKNKIDVFLQIYELEKNFPRALKKYLSAKQYKHPLSDAQVKEILSISTADWEQEENVIRTAEKKRIALRKEFYEIQKLYPIGYKIWKVRNPTAFTEETIQNRNLIEQFENNSAIITKNDAWLKSQKAFSEDCIETIKDFAPNWGRYYYAVNFESVDIEGNLKSEKLRFWNVFRNEYCLFPGLDFPTRPHIVQNNSIVRSIENNGAECIKPQWIEQLLLFLGLEYLCQDDWGVNIIINDLHCSSNTISYLIKNIRAGLENMSMVDNVILLTLSELEMPLYNEIKCNQHCYIIDLFTPVYGYYKIVDKVIKSLNRLSPTIIYYSFFKEYSKSEIDEITSSDLRKIETVKADEIAKQQFTKLFEEVTKQWETTRHGLPISYLFYYYPVSISVDREDIWEHRNIVWNFKNAPHKIKPEDNKKAIEYIINGIKEKLTKLIPIESLRYLTLVCIPASTQEKTICRYKDFSERICSELGLINAYSHIRVIEGKQSKHEGGNGLDFSKIHFDADFFKDKVVLIFDDVFTRGETMNMMADKLRSLGSNVICGFSICKTKHLL